MPPENDVAATETQTTTEVPSLSDVISDVLEPTAPTEETDPENPPLDDAEQEDQGPADGDEQTSEPIAEAEKPTEDEGGEASSKEDTPKDDQGKDVPGEEAQASEETTDDDPVENVSDEELNKYDRKTFKKKIRSAVQQRGREKSRADGLQAQLDQMSQSLGVQDVAHLPQVIQENAALAQTTRQFNTFMQDNNLDVPDVERLFTVGAAISAGDWAKAKEIMGPYIEIMNAELDGDLPQDIRQAITEGRYDEETGKQLARDRVEHNRTAISAARAEAAATQAANQIQQSNRAAQQNAQVQAQNDIVQFMDRWGAEKRQNDPDFQVKEKLIINHLKARRATEGMPASIEVAKQWAEEALAEANTLLRPAAKPASTTKPSAPAPTGSGKQGAPQPQSIAEVVDRVLSGSQAA